MPEPINADKTAPNEEGFDSFNQLGDEGWVSEDAALDETKEEETSEESTEEDSPEKSTKKEDSAVYQKRRYRQQLKAAEKRIEDLERKLDTNTQNRPLTEDEQREQQARDALRKILREELADLEGEKTRAEQQASAQLEEELDEVLDENPDFTEKEILDVCDDLTVSPRKAVAILKRERKNVKKPPTLPQPRKGSPEVKDSGEKSPKTFEEAGRHIKDLLKKGKVY